MRVSPATKRETSPDTGRCTFSRCRSSASPSRRSLAHASRGNARPSPRCPSRPPPAARAAGWPRLRHRRQLPRPRRAPRVRQACARPATCRPPPRRWRTASGAPQCRNAASEVDPGLVDRIADRHVARHPAQQRRAKRDDHREAIHQREQHAAGKHDQRDRYGQADDQQGISCALRLGRAATAMTLSRLITRSASRMVRIAAIMLELPAAWPSFLVPRDEQLDGNPQQQQGADDLQVGQAQQLDRDDDQDDAHHHRGGAAPQDRLFALVRWQLAQASAMTTALSPDSTMSTR